MNFCKTVLLSLLLLSQSTFLIHAQTFDTVSVFYDINAIEPISTKPIDSLIASLEYQEQARILGYADYLGSKEANEELAENRAKQVAKYILRNANGKLKLTSIKGNGELPQQAVKSEDGDAKSRRVDVIVKRDILVSDKVYEDEPVKAMQIDVEKGQSVDIEGLEFIPGRHYPLPEARPALESLLKAMQENPQLEIKIIGHICCQYGIEDGYDPDTRDNKLSENRAHFVHRWLADHGIDESRMTYEGRGSSDPKIYPEETEEDKRANRRVEIEVINR